MDMRTGKWRVWAWLRVLPLLLMLALLAAPAGVPAQQVNQCLDGRTVSYQATPCSTGQPLKQWPLAASVPASRSRLPPTHDPAPSGTFASQAPARMRKQRAASAPRTATIRLEGRGGGKGDPASSASCESMRAQRAAAYEKVGLKRGFALSSHWDNKVHQACR